MIVMIGCVVAAIAVLEIAGRRAARTWSVQPEESVDDPDATTPLNIGPVAAAGAPRLASARSGQARLS